MAIHSYALTTLNNLKTYLNISGSAKDALLELLINAMTDHIESYCNNRRFADTTYTQVEYDGTGTKTLILDQYPITTTTTFVLEENSEPDNEDDWETLASRRYWTDDEGMVRTYDILFLKSPYKYRVTYSAGYTTIPSDLEMACIMLCSEFYLKGGSTGVVSETLGDHSITFNQFSQLSQDSTVKAILDKYKDLRV